MSLLLSATLILGAGSPAEADALGTRIEQLYEEIRQSSTWRSPSVRGRTTFLLAVRRLSASLHDCDLSKQPHVARAFRGTGYDLEWLTSDVVSLHETAGSRAGGGLYLFRCGQTPPIILQAPHSIFDVHTRSICQQLFVGGHYRAAFFNTVHRFLSHPREKRGSPNHPADVVDQPGSLFHAATVAMAVTSADSVFVQLHGFRQIGDPVDIVVSVGEPVKSHPLLSNQLAAIFPKTKTFGVDTDQLGATLNVQGRFLNELGPNRFVHLELSRPTRETLRRGDQLQPLGSALRGLR